MSPSRSSTSSSGAVAIVALSGVLLTGLWLRGRKSKRKEDWLDMPCDLKDSGYETQIKLAIRLAIEAGDNMKSYCEAVGTQHEQVNELQINTKGKPEDFCTAIDLENEALIERGILTEFPSHSIIGEESTGTSTIPPLTTNPTWIIDPIDGTTNFASAIPLTCVSIGYCEDGRPVMGVVYAPLTQEMYVGVKGYGSYRNGIRLNATSKDVSLKDAIVVFEFGYTRDLAGIATMVGGLQRVLNHGCRAVRGFGSGVLDLCYVARGSIDVVYAGIAGEGWKPWDHCAGMVICIEAGCCMESLVVEDDPRRKPKQEFDLYSTSVICAVNQQLLNDCRTVVCKGL